MPRASTRGKLTLLLRKIHGVVLRIELNPGSLHVVCTGQISGEERTRVFGFDSRTGPAHERILPSPATWQSIEINPPFLSLCTTALHCIPRWLVDSHNTVTQLDCSHKASDIWTPSISIYLTRCTAEHISFEHSGGWAEGCDIFRFALRLCRRLRSIGSLESSRDNDRGLSNGPRLPEMTSEQPGRSGRSRHFVEFVPSTSATLMHPRAQASNAVRSSPEARFPFSDVLSARLGFHWLLVSGIDAKEHRRTELIEMDARRILVYSPQILENYQLQSGEGLSVLFVVIWLFGDITNLVGAALAGLLPTVVILAVYVSEFSPSDIEPFY